MKKFLFVALAFISIAGNIAHADYDRYVKVCNATGSSLDIQWKNTGETTQGSTGSFTLMALGSNDELTDTSSTDVLNFPDKSCYIAHMTWIVGFGNINAGADNAGNLNIQFMQGSKPTLTLISHEGINKNHLGDCHDCHGHMTFATDDSLVVKDIDYNDINLNEIDTKGDQLSSVFEVSHQDDIEENFYNYQSIYIYSVN